MGAEPIVVAIRVAAELERLGVEYSVGGSLASSLTACRERPTTSSGRKPG